MERRAGTDYHTPSSSSSSHRISAPSAHPVKERTATKAGYEEGSNRYRQNGGDTSNYIHHNQQQQQQQQQHQPTQYSSSKRHATAPNNSSSHETLHSKSSRNYDSNLYDYANESRHVTQSRNPEKGHPGVDYNHNNGQQRTTTTSRAGGAADVTQDGYYDDGDGDVSSVRSSRQGGISSGRGELSDRSSDTGTSVRGSQSRERSSRRRDETADYHQAHNNHNRHHHHQDTNHHHHRRSHSRQRGGGGETTDHPAGSDPKPHRGGDRAGVSENSRDRRKAREDMMGSSDQVSRDSYDSRRVRSKDVLYSDSYDSISSQYHDDNNKSYAHQNDSHRRVTSSSSRGDVHGDGEKQKVSSRKRRETEPSHNGEKLSGHKSVNGSVQSVVQADICPETEYRYREEKEERGTRSRRSASAQNIEQHSRSESRRRSSNHRQSSQEYATLPSRENGYSEHSSQASHKRRSRNYNMADEEITRDEIVPTSSHRDRYSEENRYQSMPRERRRRDNSRGEIQSSESRHSDINDDNNRRRSNGRGSSSLYSSESRHSNIAHDQFYDVSTVDRRSHRRRGADYDSHHDGSSHHRRSVSSYDEPEVSHSHHFRRDNSLSNRSSSSRSNHDTGFHSSASSPRREESLSRFSSDISPSRYHDDDYARQSSGYETTKSRRRSRISSSKNNSNSLDVPKATLRKDRSLSSSGRGDSSFEETGQENEDQRGNGHDANLHKNIKTDSGQPVLCNGDVGNKESLMKDAREKEMDKMSSMDSQIEGGGLVLSPEKSLVSQEDSSRAECTSSTSTLRGGYTTANTSKISFTGSISSLLSRDQPSRSGTSEHSFSMSSVSDKWRKLRQGIAPDQGSTSSFASNASSLFSSAASKLMSSLPKVPSSFPKAFSSTAMNSQPSESATEKMVSDSALASRSPESKAVNCKEARSEILANAKKSPLRDTMGVPHTTSSPSCQSSKSPTQHVKSPSFNHSGHHTDSVNDVLSTRTSLASTSLSLHSKRANAYVVTKEPEPEEEEEDLEDDEPLTPDSEESGQMTPPPMDTDMKRRSKEVDGELTSFLPAEMSRREEKFHDAARVNDAVAIRTILKEKVNVNCRNSLDRTALHWASANGNLAAVEVLVEGGADLEAKDKYGMRAVLWAAWFGHIPVLQALVNAGANTKIANKQGLGILHCAAENNHAAVIAFIFESLEPHNVNHTDKNDRTALHASAESGHAQTVDVLLQAKADLHKKDKGGRTCVHLAASNGHVEVLKIVLLQGVEVDDRDVEGKTALHLAAEGGHKDIVDLLLDYTANPNSETVKEITPLHMAAMEGHIEVCKSLVKYGCNVNAQNFQGNAALHLAANANHKDVARVLIDAKCETDLPNSRLQTPLHIAVESGHLEVVQILLAGGASLEAKEKSGKSALQLAARGNHVSVVDMLIKAERYYAIAREYHDKDVGYVDPDTYLRNAAHPNASQMSDVLWKLAMKQLKPTDWKKLAHYWKFTAEHIKAIEQEYTGTMSYKDHGYRLLLIWLHSVRKDENVLKLLFEALVGIDKRHLAESIRRKANMVAEKDKPCSPAVCAVS